MNREDIIKYNIDCAVYCGFRMDLYLNKFEYPYKNNMLWFCRKYSRDGLLFHFDWNWIHGILTIIQSRKPQMNNGDTTYSTYLNEISHAVGRCNLESTMKAISNFLQWHYNKEKSNILHFFPYPKYAKDYTIASTNYLCFKIKDVWQPQPPRFLNNAKIIGLVSDFRQMDARSFRMAIPRMHFDDYKNLIMHIEKDSNKNRKSVDYLVIVEDIK